MRLEGGSKEQNYSGRRLGFVSVSVFTDCDFEQVIKLLWACLLFCLMGLGVLGELSDNTREEDLAQIILHFFIIMVVTILVNHVV